MPAGSPIRIRYEHGLPQAEPVSINKNRQYAMSSHPYDRLSLTQGRQMIFTPCPGTKGVDLAASIRQLHDAGASAIITMMPDEELAKFGVSALPELVGQAGMQWFQFPVEDDAAPGHVFEQTWEQHKTGVLALVEQGECVAIHCRGGSGRTGFMAAVILRELGLNGPEATALITGLRPKSLKLAAHSDYLTSHYDTKSEQELLP